MSAPITILFVCTGNVCRSPAGQLLLQAELLRRRSDATDWFSISSAGLDAALDRPIDPQLRRLLERDSVLGTAAFRSRRLTAPVAERADLILTGSNEHRQRFSSDSPAAYRRTFTLAEAAELLRADTGHALPYTELTERAHAVTELLIQRRAAGGKTPAQQMDLVDPHGKAHHRYRHMVRLTRRYVRVLAEAFVPQSLSDARTARGQTAGGFHA